MTANTTIEWTDKTWNPIRARLTAKGRAHFGVTKAPKVGHFCVHVSEGCRNCYAERRQPYYGHGARDSYRKSYLDQGLIEVYLDEKELLAPLHWRKPCRVFPCSMTDLFGEWVPDAWIDRVKAVIALTPHITYQVLSKRSKRMREYMAAHGRKDRIREAAGIFRPGAEFQEPPWPLPNLHLGVSPCDQATADDLIPDLLETPAAVRFLSLEPLLGPVDVKPWAPPIRSAVCWDKGYQPTTEDHAMIARIGRAAIEKVRKLKGKPSRGIDHVIVGGESGPGARPMHPDWARSVRDQCQAAGVAYFFKQWGEFTEVIGEPRMIRHRDVALAISGAYSDVTRVLELSGNVKEGEDCAIMRHVGKKCAGRLLDGREWNEFPGVNG